MHRRHTVPKHLLAATDNYPTTPTHLKACENSSFLTKQRACWQPASLDSVEVLHVLLVTILRGHSSVKWPATSQLSNEIAACIAIRPMSGLSCALIAEYFSKVQHFVKEAACIRGVGVPSPQTGRNPVAAPAPEIVAAATCAASQCCLQQP